MPGRSDDTRLLFDRIERTLRDSSPELLTFLPARIHLSGHELCREIRRVAERLEGAGIRPGSRVLLATTHPLVMVLVVPAVWSLRSVPIPGEGSASEAALRTLIRRLGPDLVLGEEAWGRDSKSWLIPPLPLLHLGFARTRLRISLPRETVLVRTTSGTSGPARGVALSASQLLADGRAILHSLPLPPEIRGLAAVPLGHAYGFSTLLTPLLFHARPLVLLEQPLPQIFRAALGRFPSLFFPGVPFLYRLLLESGLRTSLLSRLKLCVCAGAPLSPQIAERFHRRTGIPIRNFYGATECGAVAWNSSPTATRSGNCVGSALAGVRIRLRSGAGAGSPREGEGARIGRVEVAGPAVALGYVEAGRRPRRFRGCFRSADYGSLDSRGRLHLAGRRDRMINVGGRKVWPEEVEAVLGRAPGIREAVAIGIPDRLRGEAVAAAVTGSDRLRTSALIDFCREHLSGHRAPRRLLVLPEIPRTPRGKIDFERLRALLVADR